MTSQDTRSLQSTGKSGPKSLVVLRNLDLLISGIAGLFLLVLPLLPDAFSSLADKVISDDDIRTATGLLITAIAILFAIGRQATEALLKSHLAPVTALANIEALSQEVGHSDLRELLSQYSKMPHREMTDGRDAVIRRATRELQEMSFGVRALSSSEYSAAQITALRNATNTDKVVAMASRLYDSPGNLGSREQLAFEEAAKEAANRGVFTTRLFMVAANEYDDLVELPFVRSHADGSIQNLVGKVVFLDKVRQVDPQLAQEAITDEGYLLVGDRVLFADDRTAVATVRGRAVFNSLEIERVRRIHERLEEHALEIDLKFHPVTKRPIRQPVAPIQDRLLSVYTAEQELRERQSKELQDVSLGYRRLNDTSSYYEWLRRRLDVEESRARTVHVISTRPLEVFIRHEQERSFMEWNQRAVEAGTEIRRIFVISETDLILGSRREALRTLLESKFDFGIAWLNDVRTYSSELTGGGLSIWDNVEVFLDRTYFVDPDAEDGELPRLARRLLIRDAVADLYFGNHDEVLRSVTRFRNIDRMARQTFGERPTYQKVLSRWLEWARAQKDQSGDISSAIGKVEVELR